MRSSTTCTTPSRGESKADMREFQQERLRNRRSRYHNAEPTTFARQLAGLSGAQLILALANYSRNPKGKKRTSQPRFSIWPEAKTTKPGRMG